MRLRVIQLGWDGVLLTVSFTQGPRRTCIYRYASPAHADNPPSFACRRLNLYERLRMLCKEVFCQ